VASMMPTTLLDAGGATTLASARQLTVTWGIPEEFGGMTSALLRRSRALAAVAGATVDIVTFDPAPDLSRTRERLAERGELISGVSIRNVFEDLRTRSRPVVEVEVPPAPSHRPADEEVRGPDGAILRWRDGDKLVRTEHRRADDSLALVDEQRRPSGPPRIMTSFDQTGATTGQWVSASALYFDWLDDLVAGEPAVVTVDSKAVARMMQNYRRPTVTLVYVVHGSHLAAQDPRRLDPNRRAVFENLHLWDAVVFLTERQRVDVIDLLGDTGNLAVVPNSLTAPAAITRLPPDRLHGVVVSRLSALKRFDHALRIVANVRAMGLPVTLDIVGDGRQRPRLEREARRLGVHDAVRFSGYDSSGAARFTEGAWTLLTSRSEGSSLVLLEAMAAGCLPIAYDIRYGPSDAVAPGRTGWLVGDGDIQAASRALAEACVLPDAEFATRRSAARRTALTRTDSAVVALWARVQADARARHDRSQDRGPALARVRVRHLRGRYVVTAAAPRPTPLSTAVEVRLLSPGSPVVRNRMRSFGRIRFAYISRAASDGLGNGPVHTRFAVTTPDDVIVVDAGVRHPDRRSIVRRAFSRADRWRRRVLFR
jgi:poly(glycerol-phosphate) alpha-glucosyltransferase